MNRRTLFAAATALLVAVHGAMAASPLVDGEVKKVDKAAARLTLKHGEIKSMDIPAITMAYKVKDPAMLDKVQPGDHVKFSIERIDSQYTVVQLETGR